MQRATKAELQETIDTVGEKVAEMLDPSLTRRQLVDYVRDLDELVNGSYDEDSVGTTTHSDTNDDEDDEEDEEA